MGNQQYLLNCPVTQKQVVVYAARFSVPGGMGDDGGFVQVEHECQLEEWCWQEGNGHRCPTRLKNVGGD